MKEQLLSLLGDGKTLLLNLPESALVSSDIKPYGSSILKQYRHILDYINCILQGSYHKHVNMGSRTSYVDAEKSKFICIEYLEKTIEELTSVSEEHLHGIYVIYGPKGSSVSALTSFPVLVMMMHSHVEHHHSMIAFSLAQLGLEECIPESFGVNYVTLQNNA